MSAVSEVFDAIAAGDVDRVRALAAEAPRIGLTRKDGVSAVLTARYHQRLEMVEALRDVLVEGRLPRHALNPEAVA